MPKTYFKSTFSLFVVTVSAPERLARKYEPCHVTDIVKFSTYLYLSCNDNVVVLCHMYVCLKTSQSES